MRKILLASAAIMGATFGLAGGAKAQPVKPVAPGTLVVHLNGYLQFSIGGVGSTFNTVTVPGTGTYKTNPVSTIGDFRLYTGFDAATTNGIDYGAQVELRTGYSDAGQGAGKATGSAGSAGLEGLYVKRAYGYGGMPQYGYLRFGQTDSAFTLLQNGVIEAFGDGGQWTGEGGLRDMIPTNASVGGGNNFIYADTTALYATDKIVYISPTWAGFSGVLGYEPNSNGLKEGYGNCSGSFPAATPADVCAGGSSSPVTTDVGKRRKNTVDGMVQYAITSGGVTYKASAGMLYGSPVQYDGNPVAPPAAAHYGYDNLSVYQAGGQITWNGLTVGANIKGGQVLDGYALKVKGTRDGLVYMLSGNYVIGPYVVGASFFNSQTAGANTAGSGIARTLSEYGVSVGGNYVLSKNMSLYAQYMYDHRHQPGNAFGLPATVPHSGNAQAQVIGIGATLKW